MGYVYIALAVAFVWALTTYPLIALAVVAAAAGLVLMRRSTAASAASSGHARATGVHLNVNCFTRIRDEATLEVVGEAYRQELVALARAPGAGELPDGVPPPPVGHHKAVLVPEPTNKYDPNAITVLLWAGAEWVLSGYLSRENAIAYRPLFAYLSRDLGPDGGQTAIVCDAALKPERGGIGVLLHLGSPGECMAELITDDRFPADHEWAGRPIVFTGQSRVTITGVTLDRNALLMLARWAGCEVLPRLTKKTAMLVVGDPNEVTANFQRAREYGIPIVQEPDFLAAIGIPPEAVGRDSVRWARA